MLRRSPDLALVWQQKKAGFLEEAGLEWTD